MRIWIWIALAFLVFFAVRKRLGTNSAHSARSAHTEKTVQSEAKTESMVACAYCAMHLPMSEAVSCNAQYFCSDAHAHMAAHKQP